MQYGIRRHSFQSCSTDFLAARLAFCEAAVSNATKCRLNHPELLFRVASLED